jgi:excisionase family DNA binding protein
MYRVKDVARHFDVSVSTIYRAIESGQLDALKLGRGQGTVRVPGSAVLAYAESCGQTAYETSVPGRAAGAEALAGEVGR